MARGFLKPAQKHRFRAELDNMTSKLAGSGVEFPHMVASVRCTYGKEKLIEISLREDASGLMLEFLDDLSKDQHLVFKLTRLLDKSETGVTEIFDGVQIVSRTCDWTYFDADPVEHVMILSYETVSIQK